MVFRFELRLQNVQQVIAQKKKKIQAKPKHKLEVSTK
jgi:hypothetical protein